MPSTDYAVQHRVGYTYRNTVFYILFPCGLSQVIEHSSLCYTIEPCCLFPELFDHTSAGASFCKTGKTVSSAGEGGQA